MSYALFPEGVLLVQLPGDNIKSRLQGVDAYLGEGEILTNCGCLEKSPRMYLRIYQKNLLVDFFIDLGVMKYMYSQTSKILHLYTIILLVPQDCC